MVSAMEREGKHMRLRARRLAGLVAARPRAESGEEREVGRARERAGGARCRPRAGPGREALGCWAKTKMSTENPFIFPFLIFQSIFQKDFEFNSNHSIQKFQCSNMNAQTCSYPYI
jgi:hypothetical protein